MRRIRSSFAMAVVLVACLGFAPGAAARTPVDPTTLTPPLKAFRVCWQLGPTVQCDTSGDVSHENLEADEAPCGLIYATDREISNSTRYYQDGLIVRRAVQERIFGTWTLSPTGAGPTVAFAINDSWDEHFTIPGDIDSAIRTIHGSEIRVPALGADLHWSGTIVGDEGEMHGHFSDDDAASAELCALLVP
jgi:hypothetical protein